MIRCVCELWSAFKMAAQGNEKDASKPNKLKNTDAASSVSKVRPKKDDKKGDEGAISKDLSPK